MTLLNRIRLLREQAASAQAAQVGYCNIVATIMNPSAFHVSKSTCCHQGLLVVMHLWAAAKRFLGHLILCFHTIDIAG